MTYFNWRRMLPSDLPRFGCTPGKVIVPPRPFLWVRPEPLDRWTKPRLRLGSSGTWWCESERIDTTPGMRPTERMRIGYGDTPEEAYADWLDW